MQRFCFARFLLVIVMVQFSFHISECVAADDSGDHTVSMHRKLKELGSRVYVKLLNMIPASEDSYVWDSYGRTTAYINIAGIGDVSFFLSRKGDTGRDTGRIAGRNAGLVCYAIQSDNFLIIYSNGQLSSVKIKDLGIFINLYGNMSSAHIQKDGFYYGNVKAEVIGVGQQEDTFSDDLFITYYRNFAIFGGPDSGTPIPGIGERYFELWREKNGTNINEQQAAFPRNIQQLEEICAQMNITPKISYEKTSAEVIAWLEHLEHNVEQ
ncbi:MAG: hypothetical protein HQK53_07400 [Oligoflexia bacterium]|nr:hypothetical protein [Oligoflexia bacterium]